MSKLSILLIFFLKGALFTLASQKLESSLYFFRLVRPRVKERIVVLETFILVTSVFFSAFIKRGLGFIMVSDS